jgi:peptide/nickel transport system substrate-binding protein
MPNLATAWTASPDATKYHFDLRQGVKWHDGQPFTAADVEFSVKASTNKETKSTFGEQFNFPNIVGGADFADGKTNTLPGLKVLDDHTIEFQLEKPDAAFLANITQFNLQAKHVFDGIAYKDLIANSHSTHDLIGTGPFKVVKYVPDQYVNTVANPDYHLGAPYIQAWDHILYKDINSAALALQSGDISTITNPTGDTLNQLLTLPGAQLAGGPVLFSNGIGFNFKKPAMQDKGVRQAFIYALDRQKLIDTFYKSRGRVINSNFTPDLWRNKETDKLYPYDPAKAKSLLQAANWDSNHQVRFITYYQDTTSKNMFAAFQQAWKAVGINTDMTFMDGGAFIKACSDGDFETLYEGGDGGFEPDVQRTWFQSDLTYPKGLNYYGYANPQVDALFKQGLQTSVYQER